MNALLDTRPTDDTTTSPTSSLVVEVAAHLSVIPAINAQLEETARQVETAVVGVCANFQGIADKARRGVAVTAAIVESADGTDGFGWLLGRLQQTMRGMDARLTATATRAMNAIDRLGQVERALRDVNRSLGQIEDLATSLRLLAINAKIEAVRSGDRGAGFGVVADEMQRAGKEAREVSEQIRDDVTHMTAETSALAALLRDGAQADLDSIEASRHDIEADASALAQNHQALHDSARDSAAVSQALAEDITAAVIGLQFQDRVNQRIHHVVEALTHMQASVAATVPAVDGEGAQARATEVQHRLQASYTMWEERADGAPTSGDVELF